MNDFDIPEGYRRDTIGICMLHYNDGYKQKRIYFLAGYVMYRRKNSLFIIFNDYSYNIKFDTEPDKQRVKESIDNYVSSLKDSGISILNRKFENFHVLDIINKVF